jgi:2-succinyl-5-enolpyruvyl-6-hydroxy-3-cyclohexene-1-carboxylate synthase
MDKQAPNPLYAFIGAFIDELVRADIRHIVICPGSRSTPLAISAANNPDVQLHVLIDERSAGFFALGLAKYTGKPSVLICTSGTAAANFLPAIVEAHQSHIPMLVLTADRPHELREVGAPQTIDQNRLYGIYTKWFIDVALPEASNAALTYIRSLACRAIAEASFIPSGPVHLNFPLREPLTPDPGKTLSMAERDPIAWYGRPNGKPYTHINTPLNILDADSILSELADSVIGQPKGLLIVGSGYSQDKASTFLSIAKKLGYPLLADPLSGLRGPGKTDPLLITSYDAFLRDERFVKQNKPDIIIRFGAMPVSKAVLLYLQQYADVPQIIISPYQDWPDPTLTATRIIHAYDPGARKNLPPTQPDYDISANQIWQAQWKKAEHISQKTLYASIEAHEDCFEGRVFIELTTLLPDNSLLFLGNSMPIRDCDTFFWPESKQIKILCNRGANGIDGVVSSALGASSVHQGPSVLVIGDLSFYHDLNGLLAAKLFSLNIVIALINNNGGGIFSFLPQSNYPNHFEQLFGTPTDLDFSHVVAMYNGSFTRTSDWNRWRAAIQKGITTEGLHVVELQTDRRSNVTLHRQLWADVSQRLNAEGVTQ